METQEKNLKISEIPGEVRGKKVVHHVAAVNIRWGEFSPVRTNGEGKSKGKSVRASQRKVANERERLKIARERWTETAENQPVGVPALVRVPRERHVDVVGSLSFSEPGERFGGRGRKAANSVASRKVTRRDGKRRGFSGGIPGIFARATIRLKKGKIESNGIKM